MAHTQLRQQAIELRNRGKTYSEIRKQIQVAKSTLSDWLSKYPLDETQLILLAEKTKNKRYITIEKVRNIKQKKRKLRLENLYNEQKSYWKELTSRELNIAGLFLYWGEGNKSLPGRFELCNTNPQILKFTLYWLTHHLEIPVEKIKVHIHLYSDMNIYDELTFWSHQLKLPIANFTKPYIKASKRVDITHKGFGHGTCALVVYNIRLKEKIIMGVSAIADNLLNSSQI